MIPGDIVVLDGGEIKLENTIDGGEIGTTTILVPNLQDKTVTPAAYQQIVVPDISEGYLGLSSVTVEAIPNNYGLVIWDGQVLTVK